MSEDGRKSVAGAAARGERAAEPAGPVAPEVAGSDEPSGALSDVERIKRESRGLRGPLVQELSTDSTHLGEDARQILKFHGSYEQEDRDQRKERKRAGLEPAYQFMIRSKLPGGVLTPEQYLAHDDIAGRLGSGSLRVTTRQDFQVHGILKRSLRSSIRELNQALVTTFGACGDVNRNVLTCPAPLPGTLRPAALEVARAISERLLPRTGAYHEIWLDGEPWTDGGAEAHGANGANGADGTAGAHGASGAHGAAAAHEASGASEASGAADADGGKGASAVAGGTGAGAGAGSGDGSGAGPDPVYGESYLPRKFKVAIAFPDDNCTDVYTNDLGLVAVAEGDRLLGFDVLVGGGLGQTHGKPETYPRLASPLGYAPLADVPAVAEAVLAVQRDHGNRSNRRRARLKYLLDERGVDWFRSEVERRLGHALEPSRGVRVHAAHDHLGWTRQEEGRWCYGLFIENGRIRDTGDVRLRTGLRAVVERLRPAIHLTPQQNLLFVGLRESQRSELEALLGEHGIERPERVEPVRRLSMACPALPTCGLAVAESERVLPALIRELHGEMERLGLGREPITVRMTGCPNGCARPYNAEIAFVGRSLGKYVVYLGGNPEGTRLADAYADLVPQDRLVATVVPVLERFREQRREGESFGAFWLRARDELTASAPASPTPAARRVSLRVGVPAAVAAGGEP